LATHIQQVWYKILDLDELSEALSRAVGHSGSSLMEIIADPELI
jgi:hypothetical protein